MADPCLKINVRETYTKTSGTHAMDGFLYEMKLYNLVLLRALNRKHKFYLASNMRDAFLFDDIALRTERQGHTPEVLLVQAKHKKDSTRRMKVEEFFTSRKTGEKSVAAKYFDSSSKLAGNFKPDSSNPIFRAGSIEDVDLTLVHYTNEGLDADIIQYLDCLPSDQVGSLQTVLTNEGTGESRVYKINSLGKEKVLMEIIAKSTIEKVQDVFSMFCHSFHLVVGQASESELDKYIVDEIPDVEGVGEAPDDKKEINTLLTETALEIWKDSTGGAKDFETLESNILYRILNHKYLSLKEPSYNDLQYEDNAVLSLSQILAQSNVISIHAPEKEVGVYLPLIKQCANQQKASDIFVINAIMFTGILKDVITSKWITECVFLVIKCAEVDHCREILDQLTDELSTLNTKCLIFHGKPNPTVLKPWKSLNFCALDNYFKFNQLTKNCMEIILQREISFQGAHLKLSEVFNDCLDLIDSKLLSEVLTNPQLEIGSKIDGLGDVVNYYIPRCFSMNVEEGKGKTKTIPFNVTERELLEKHIVANSDNQSKLTIILGDAGTGKSTILKQLSFLLKENHSKYWVIHMTLNSFKSEFDDFEAFKPDTAIQFINEFVLKNTCSSRFRDFCLRTKKVVLLLDGFDEIAPDYKNIVLSFISALHQTQIHRIVLSTRPHLIQELKEKFSIHQAELTRFSSSDVRKFLALYIKEKIRLELHVPKNYTDRNMEDFITDLIQSLNENMSSVIEIALQARMVADIHFQDFLDWISKTSVEPFSHHSFEPSKNILDLYHQFFESKLEIYVREKLGHKSKMEIRRAMGAYRQIVFEKHVFYSAVHICNENQMLNDQLKGRKVEEDDQELLKSFGIIVTCEDVGHIGFIHKTFAEFFFAYHILNVLQSNDPEDNIVTLAETILRADQYKVVRKFLNFSNLTVSDMIAQKFGILIVEYYSSSKYDESAVLHTQAREDNGAIFDFLLRCIGIEHEEIVDALEFEIDFGLNCLSLAAENSTYITKQILKFDVNVNKISWEHDDYEAYDEIDIGVGTIALHFSKDRDVFELILSRGARYNDTDPQGNTSLHKISGKGNLDLVKHILDKYITHRNTNDTMTVTILPQAQPEAKIPEYGRRKLSTRRQESMKEAKKITDFLMMQIFTPQIEAATSNLVEEPKFGNEVDVTNKLGQTALHVAVIAGQTEMAKLLIDHGSADINLVDKDGRSVLHHAVDGGHLNTIKWLVEDMKVDIHPRDNNNCTPLHLVVKGGKYIEREHLFSLCEPPTSKPISTDSSEYKHCLKVFTYLHQNGADLNVVNLKGNTALHIAAKYGFIGHVGYVVKHGEGTIVNVKNKRGNTSLHVAAKNDHVETISVLLRHGSKVDSQNIDGDTPLHVACRFKRLKAVECLVVQGKAELDVMNIDRDTPVHVALKAGTDGWIRIFNTVDTKSRIVKLLVNSGANLEARNGDGLTPRELASKLNLEPDVMSVFAEHEDQAQNQ